MRYESRFRKEQREAKLAYKQRGTVLWVSCVMTSTFGAKEQIEGTYRRDDGRGLRGKAAKKAAKRLTHIKRYYSACKFN